jgi:DNA-binding Xre family transcriptional regulator
METKGRISFLLAHQKMEGGDITTVKALSEVSGVPRYALDAMNNETPNVVRIEYLHAIANTLNLSTLAYLLGVDPKLHRKRAAENKVWDRPIMAASQKKGYTQQQLAQVVKMRVKTLRELDKGEAIYVNLSHLAQLCDLLELSVDTILRYDGASEQY